MPKVAYADLLDEHAKPYLIVGMVGALKPEHLRDRSLAELLEQLCEALALRGKWAVGAMADGGDLAMHCVFVDKIDADRVAAAVQAAGISRYPGFSSQREFRFDARAQATVRKALRGSR